MDYFALTYAALSSLALRRPVFHSEADFQHELAIELAKMQPGLNIRLEYPVPGGALDMVLLDQAGKPCFAIELKYRKARLETEIAGEQFRLLNHGARDHGAYAIWQDVSRIEQFEAGKLQGLIIVITNDRGYLTEAKESTNFYDFRLSASRKLYGSVELNWRDPLSQSFRQYPKTIALKGEYHLEWSEYSLVPGSQNVHFFCLKLEVNRH